MEQIRYKKVVDSGNALGHNISNEMDLEKRRKRKATSRKADFPSARKGQIRYQAGPAGPQQKSRYRKDIYHGKV